MKRKPKIRKPEKPIKVFIEPVSARNSETGQDELYFVVDGQRIAKRHRTWVPLIEGVTFYDELPGRRHARL
jgi:hypothetical protein